MSFINIFSPRVEFHVNVKLYACISINFSTLFPAETVWTQLSCIKFRINKSRPIRLRIKKTDSSLVFN